MQFITRRIAARNIVWDTETDDDQPVPVLPSTTRLTVLLHVDAPLDDAVVDALSEEYGFLVVSCDYTVLA